MKNNLSIAAFSLALSLIIGVTAAVCPAQGDSLITDGSFKGTLHVGKADSYFVYVGEESGDFAAFCFANNSAAGRAVLAKCKNGDICQFQGKVDQGAGCKVDKEIQKVLSGSGKIMSVRSVKLISAAETGKGQKTSAVPSAANTPEKVVAALYAAHKNGKTYPFFQVKNRAAVDKYFTKDFADLIWKERVATEKSGEIVGLDFDPPYNAQDMQITAFKIEKPMYGEGNLKVADVPVTFKNFGRDFTVLFKLEQGADKTWKISNIFYPEVSDSPSSLGEILSNALTAVPDAPGSPKTTSDIRGFDFLNYDYKGSVCSEDLGLPKTVKVTGGGFKDADNNFFNVSKDEIVYGDVNGDGAEDAAVLIRCGSLAGTLRAFEIHAYAVRDGKASLLGRVDSSGVESDYKKAYAGGTVFFPGENPPRVANGHLIFEALTDGSFASPANVATFDYKLSGGKLVLSGKPTRSKRK